MFRAPRRLLYSASHSPSPIFRKGPAPNWDSSAYPIPPYPTLSLSEFDKKSVKVSHVQDIATERNENGSGMEYTYLPHSSPTARLDVSSSE